MTYLPNASRIEELEAEVERLRAELAGLRCEGKISDMETMRAEARETLAAERERCARIAELWGNLTAAQDIAAAIRRGEP